MTEQMKSGRELDKAVAETMGKRVLAVEGDYVLATEPGKPYDKLPKYSTKIKAAMQAWEWLEGYITFSNVRVCLVRNWEGKPSVSKMVGVEIVEEVIGESYPHAIALAVILTKEDEGWQ